MNYLYHLVRDAEFHAHSPEREAFRKHLALVANALRSIEWNDSGDGDDQEVHNIMACISLSASENEMLRAEVERLTRQRDEARAALEPFSELYLWPDDAGRLIAERVRSREDWDEAANDAESNEYGITRGDIRAARRAMEAQP